METMKKSCSGMETKLAEMLLDPERVPAKVRAHVDECAGCREELAELRATMELMDTWEAPEPSPYFLTRLDARMREERAAEPASWASSWLERLRARISYGPSMHVRPLAAMALTVVLLVGGGAYLDVTNWDQPVTAPPQTAVVHDLQTLDNNAQLLDQLESMSTTNSSNGD
jgi:cytochrome c-type biogenesis protein CcmH/NrfG